MAAKNEAPKNEDAKAKAEAQAKDIKAKADAEAKEIVAKAMKEADEIKATAVADAGDIIDAAHETATELADEDAPLMDERDFALVEKACGAFRIPMDCVIGARVKGGTAIVATAGGHKVTYRDGDEKVDGFQPLTVIAATGVDPNPPKRKPLTMGPKKA